MLPSDKSFVPPPSLRTIKVPVLLSMTEFEPSWVSVKSLLVPSCKAPVSTKLMFPDELIDPVTETPELVVSSFLLLS